MHDEDSFVRQRAEMMLALIERLRAHADALHLGAHVSHGAVPVSPGKRLRAALRGRGGARHALLPRRLPDAGRVGTLAGGPRAPADIVVAARGGDSPAPWGR